VLEFIPNTSRFSASPHDVREELRGGGLFFPAAREFVEDIERQNSDQSRKQGTSLTRGGTCD